MLEKAAVSAHTLRYYERIGLLEEGRHDCGHRRFTVHDIDRALFIGRMRATAMPIRAANVGRCRKEARS